jgi:DNA-directed RNA polymerase specialized sigma24 family protein
MRLPPEDSSTARRWTFARASNTGRCSPTTIDTGSTRQREVLELARRRGYYAHPREVMANELAAELGVTTSTVHEHLHKAEAKLLDTS